MSEPTETKLYPGDRVRRKSGGAVGTLMAIVCGSPTAYPRSLREDRATVRWPGRGVGMHSHTSTLALSKLERIS